MFCKPPKTQFFIYMLWVLVACSQSPMAHADDGGADTGGVDAPMRDRLNDQSGLLADSAYEAELFLQFAERAQILSQEDLNFLRTSLATGHYKDAEEYKRSLQLWQKIIDTGAVGLADGV